MSGPTVLVDVGGVVVGIDAVVVIFTVEVVTVGAGTSAFEQLVRAAREMKTMPRALRVVMDRKSTAPDRQNPN